MRFLNKFIYSIGGVILVLALIGLFLPAQAVVKRSTAIDAGRATVFALLNDFHQVNRWSPWIEDDPNARIEIIGPRRGVGATVAWDGHIIGRGSQTIIESVPFERVATSIDLGNHRRARAIFDLSETENGTEVVWTFQLDFNFNLAARYVGLFIRGDIGDDYEKGLTSLKSMAEGLPRTDFGDLQLEHVVVEPIDIAYQSMSSVPQPSAISEAMGKAFFNILRFIDDNGLAEAGAPLSISRAFSGSEIRFDAAIPVRVNTNVSPSSGGTVRLGKTYGGAAIRVEHIGAYRALGQTHDKIAAYLAALGIERNGDAWESYVGDPTRTDEAELLTYVFYPIVAEEFGN